MKSAYTRWMGQISAKLNCHCPSVQCLVRMFLWKNSYYQDGDFTSRTARGNR
ncbi:hypothetical protein ACEQPO_06075 [Bacillus sp. SL00103]